MKQTNIEKLIKWATDQENKCAEMKEDIIYSTAHQVYGLIIAKAKSLQEDDGWIQVKPVKDDSGHWYIVPNDLYNQFLIDSENEDMCDSGEFDKKYGEYMTGGSLNLVQLYLPNKPQTIKP